MYHRLQCGILFNAHFSAIRPVLGTSFHRAFNIAGREGYPEAVIRKGKSQPHYAFSGFLPVYLPFGTYYKVVAAITLAAIPCRLFNLLTVDRTAVVAIIIILIEKPNEGFMAPIDRFLSVLAGCVTGLLITLITAYIIKLAHKRLLLIEYKLLR